MRNALVNYNMLAHLIFDIKKYVTKYKSNESLRNRWFVRLLRRVFLNAKNDLYL